MTPVVITSISVREGGRRRRGRGPFPGLCGGLRREALEGRKANGQTYAVDNLVQTDVMGSSGIGVLMSGLPPMCREGGDVRPANPEKHIRNLIVMTHRLGPVVGADGSVDEAAQSFEENPPTRPPEE